MNLATRILRPFGALLIVLACATGAAHAAEPSQAVMLIATERLAGSGFDETVLVATPLPTGEHIGFIINRPTGLKLATVLPEYAPSRKVIDPVYLGGPLLSGSLFVLARQVPQGSDGDVIPLVPGLVLAMDAATVDRVIETMPNDARYLAGLVVWEPGELDAEIRAGAWEVRAADAGAVFHANPAGLWEELHTESGGSRMWVSADCESYWQSPSPSDLLLEVRRQSEQMTTAAAEIDWEGAFVAVGAARAALDRLRVLTLAPTGADGSRLERRHVDADGLREPLIGAEAAVRSRELSALALYGREMTELADRLLAACELDGPPGIPAVALALESESARLSSAPTLDIVACGAARSRSGCALN
jgi:putative transcriptional regulator